MVRHGPGSPTAGQLREIPAIDPNLRVHGDGGGRRAEVPTGVVHGWPVAYCHQLTFVVHGFNTGYAEIEDETPDPPFL